MKKKMCTYCAKWYPANVMTPMYERNAEYVRYYCDKCIPIIKEGARDMTWLYFGQNGEIK